jgi:general secretion pathway protein D
MKTSLGNSARRVLLPLLLGLLAAACAMQLPGTHGDELARQGQWEQAVQFFQEATKQNPQDLEARLGLARSLWAASQDFVRLGNDAERDNRLDDAKVAYRRALSYNSGNQLALVGLERISRAADIQERLGLARDRMAKKEWRAAQAEIRVVLRLDPDNAQAKELKQEVATQLAKEAPVSKLDTDAEKLAQQLFSTKPVTLRFRDTDIKEVLEVFARTAGVNIFTDESLQPKRITTFFQNLPLREAFNLILVSNRLFAKRIAENTVIVVPDNPAKRQQYDELVVETFYLTDADAKVAVNLLRTILNTRQVFVNEKLNALVVRETPEKIELARKVLEANDRNVGEVEIDMEVLEVDRTAAQTLGLDISPRTLSVTLNFPDKIPVDNAWNAIKVGSTLSITNPSLILNLVKNDSHTKILANPTVRILDRQKARLLIGQRRPFLISSISSVPSVSSGTSTGTAATGAVTTTQTNVEYRDLGLKVTLTPTVHLDGEVTVELNFEISAVGPPIADVPGSNLLPPVNTRNLDTFIKVRNGETRLLGGLYQQDESVANSQIPFLSSIPVLGRVFSSPAETASRTDVLISLTPRIVKTMSRPDADIQSFPSGTADSFGPAGGAGPAVPPQVAPPRPATPAQPTPAGPGGGPAGPGAPGVGPRP